MEPSTLLVIAGFVGAAVLVRISKQLERIDEKLHELLEHEGVAGYVVDADPD